ncbi:MAG: DUF6691 family protein [Aeromonas sp.]
MRETLTSLLAQLSGLLFGVGLMVSGMANPAKVQGFLDITRQWDPSLALVVFTTPNAAQTALNGEPISLPTATQIDKQRVGGAALFEWLNAR